MNEQLTVVQIEVYQDEDWTDAFELSEGTRPLDLTGGSLELTIRPIYDHVTLIRKLTSSGIGAEILIDTPVAGGAAFSIAQAVVAANLPIGTWEQFLVFVDAGAGRREIWRGPFIVYPGRVA